MDSPIHVAVGVVQNTNGQILIARRPAHLHQGGLWEFPGGKVETGEDVIGALRRELHEETGIQIAQSHQLISLEHDYGDKKVMLDVYKVDAFSGTAEGCEGQEIRWVSIPELHQYAFPEANRAILNAVRLPDRYMITGEYANAGEYLDRVQRAIEQGVSLIQLRAKHLSKKDFLELVKKIQDFESEEVMLLLNTSPDIFVHAEAKGLHLGSAELMRLQARPVAEDKLLSASVHDMLQLKQANRIGVDLLLVSPVLPTASHPGAAALGWEKFSGFVRQANCPVYALGGMKVADTVLAKQYGAQGVAGIRLFE